jgi:predicted lipopolysaccharide heptosyltransferase III
MKDLELLPGLPHLAKILFIRLRSLGDTILSTPLYAALKAWRPDLRIAVMIERPNDEVLWHNPDIEEIICLGRNLRDRWSALSTVRQRHFDCCINLHGGSTSAWLTALSRARHRIGDSRFRNSYAYNLRIDSDTDLFQKKKAHTVEYQIEWLRALGLPEAEIPSLRVYLDPGSETAAKAHLQKAGVERGADIAVIQPTSKFHTKEWTAEGFAEIADYLNRQYGLSVLLTGGPGEEKKLANIHAKSGTKPAVLTFLSVAELAWILSRARVFVGNDSGPTHLATALSIPVVVLFGSSDSAVWHPWRVRHRIVQNLFDCNPCPGYRCLVYDEPRCILSISSSQVKTAIDDLLGNTL